MRGIPAYLRNLAILSCILSTLICCDRRIAGGKADGKAVFEEVCAKCHGRDGSPSRAMRAAGAKDLATAIVQGMSDDELERQIRNGSKNRAMPGFGKLLTKDQVREVVNYVRSLKKSD